MTDSINLRISKTAPLGGRVFDDPLTFQGTVLLRILMRRIPEQHICRRKTKKQKNRVREGRRKKRDT